MKMISGKIIKSKIIKYTKIIKSLLGEGDPGSSGFYSASYFGSQSLLHVGALYG